MHNSEINIREYAPGDEYGIVNLFNSSDSRFVRNVNFWKWSNCNNYNNGFISVVAELKDGSIIGHYSIVDREIIYMNKVRTIGFGQQAVTHYQYRGLDNILNICQQIYSLAASRYDYLYAFPNNNMFPIKKRLLNWTDLGEFNADVIDIEKIPSGVKQTNETRQIFALPKEVDGILRYPSDQICLKNNSEFLNYRFVNNPINQYTMFGAFDEAQRLVGYIIAKLYYDKNLNKLLGHLVDYEATQNVELVFNDLLNESKRFFEFYGVDLIVFWNQKNLYKQYFDQHINKEKKGFMTNFGLLELNPSIPSISSINQWSFSMAHSDAF